MPSRFRIEVVQQDGVDFSGEASYARVPGHDGYFGIMADHAPMIAEIGIGELIIQTPDLEKHIYAVSGGIAEVGSNRLLLLVRSAEALGAIDLQRAEAAAERARERVKGASRPASGIDVERAQAALARALNRVRVANKPRL